MEKTLNKLKEYGCDVDGALIRMLDDKEFLLQCMKAAIDEDEYELLGAALAENDVTKAFELAHAIKGVTANVGLNPLMNKVALIVEPLRAGNMTGLNDEYTDMLKIRNDIRKILSEEEE